MYLLYSEHKMLTVQSEHLAPKTTQGNRGKIEYRQQSALRHTQNLQI